MNDRPFREVPSEKLRKLLKGADREIGKFVDGLYISDPKFKSALDLSLSIEDELAARRNIHD